MASSILEVDQFVLTPVTTATLDAEDEETPRDELVFNVTVPPAGGYITHLDDQTREVRSFTWTDLNDLKIAYQPPHSGQSQRSNDQVQTHPCQSQRSNDQAQTHSGQSQKSNMWSSSVLV